VDEGRIAVDTFLRFLFLAVVIANLIDWKVGRRGDLLAPITGVWVYAFHLWIVAAIVAIVMDEFFAPLPQTRLTAPWLTAWCLVSIWHRRHAGPHPAGVPATAQLGTTAGDRPRAGDRG
jgi:hypothetical protein